MKKTSVELQEWTKVKRQCGLSDAHVQMARELSCRYDRHCARPVPVREPKLASGGAGNARLNATIAKLCESRC